MNDLEKVKGQSQERHKHKTGHNSVTNGPISIKPVPLESLTQDLSKKLWPWATYVTASCLKMTSKFIYPCKVVIITD